MRPALSHGLADSAGVSCESYNLPGRRIRHYDYSTATDRAGAPLHAQ